MPIFEYICRDCHHQFETIVSGARVPACPACRSEALDKQLSVFAVSSAGPRERAEPSGACGTCGDPRGPGSCSLN